MELMKKEIWSQLVNSYPSCVLEESSETDKLRLRLSVEDLGEVEDFKKTIGRITKTQWNAKRENSDPMRFTFWKAWVCQHSKLNKASTSKRNAKCQAKLWLIIKKLTKHTYRKDKFMKLSPPLAVLVILGLQHTHSIDTVESLKMLRVSDEVKKDFSNYFSWGMTIIEARMHHENKFLLANNYEDMANASKNPTPRQVHHLQNKWKSNNSGALPTPFEKLKERIPLYNSNGSVIKIHDVDDAWSVLLVSPLMNRAQSLESSKEIIFVDSSCVFGKTSSTLTILYTATNAGAIPIATLIHRTQTRYNYFNAFMLLKENYPDCFGGENFPALFMTADIHEEKEALATVWPESSQLLCHFYVAQTEWCELFSKSTTLTTEEGSRLMKLFLDVMYATTEENLTEAVAQLLNEQRYPEFLSRFNSFYQRRNEWVLLDRSSTVNNATNNFAEFTIRIVKDIVLCRTKAFSIVTLVEFCLDLWEKHLTKKLLELAHSCEVSLAFKSIHEKDKEIKELDVQESFQNVFLMKIGHKSYTANAEVGVCNCQVAMFGAFCKHQYYLFTTHKFALPSAPTLSIEEKTELHNFALGEMSECDCSNTPENWKSLPKDGNALLDYGKSLPEGGESLPEDDDFFPDFDEFLLEDDDFLPENEQSLSEAGTGQNSQEINLSAIQTGTNNQIDKMASQEDKNQIVSELNRIADKISKSTFTKTKADHIINTLKKIKTVDDLDRLFFLKNNSRIKKTNVHHISGVVPRLELAKAVRSVPEKTNVHHISGVLPRIELVKTGKIVPQKTNVHHISGVLPRIELVKTGKIVSEKTNVHHISEVLPRIELVKIERVLDGSSSEEITKKLKVS